MLDDYPYWVGQELGYFGDLETKMEAGPSDGTATVKFVAVGQADMGFPSPGVFSFAIENDMDLVSVFNMGAVDVFDFAFRVGEGVTDLKELEGKTVLLGSAAWQAITDPMFAAAGVDPKSITYLEGGWPQWGTVLLSGQGDAALAWEGLRADWQGKGLEFEYWLGSDHSNFPANVFVVRRSDVEDPVRHAALEQYLRGWAMGLEFARLNPRAAVAAVFNQFPIVENDLGPDLGTESLMQLARVFRGNMEDREGWGWHELGRWGLVRQANWQKVGGASPLERRSNRTTFLREPCVGSREGAGEASVAAWMGRAIEHRKSDGPGCRGFQIGRRQYRRRRFGEMSASPAVSENPCTFARLLLGPWEVFKLPRLS